MSLWIANDGEKRTDLLRDPQPIHGGLNEGRAPVWITLDGKRVDVLQRSRAWTGFDVLGHSGPSAAGWECELADGSRWLVCRDLMKGTWVGELMDSAT